MRFRIGKEEKKIIDNYAKRLGMKTSEFCRLALMHVVTEKRSIGIRFTLEGIKYDSEKK